jgi:23S rRNA pseudouridine1911/1915/1917 synthase
MTFVATQEGKGVQPASLSYRVLRKKKGLSRVRIKLETGRTHQIRVQFSSRGLPLVGERKYSTLDDPCDIALWSYRLQFTHPTSGEKMEFIMEPPEVYPWTEC